MNWSDAYFELGAGTLLAVVGVTFLVLIKRKAARTETPAAPPPPRSGAIRLDVRVFFYVSAVFFGFALARAAPWPWSFVAVAATLIGLVLVIRSMRSTRATAQG